MKKWHIYHLFSENIQNSLSTSKTIILNKQRFIEKLTDIINTDSLNLIKEKTLFLKYVVNNYERDNEGILNIDSDDGETISLRKDILIDELDQILKSQTIERAKYYLKRLKESIQKVKTNKINDINLTRWKEYDEIITDSLWIFDKRDTSGAHLGWYWGNFIPQIPRQLMLRYTKKGDWVLDPFVGSGTTLIECRRLGRNGIGIELNSEVAQKARFLVNKEENKYGVITDIVVGDSTELNFKKLLKEKGIEKVQLLIMHPPYHDIIKFSNNPRDLSNCKSVEEFLEMFRKVVENTFDILENGRYMALVMGDKYSNGEWIPLGFYTMHEVLKVGYKLKSIVVKNFEETRGKRNQKELWRYRALVGGFYVFKHEYIFLFRKTYKLE